MLARRSVGHPLVRRRDRRDVRRGSRVRRCGLPRAVRRGRGRQELERLRVLLPASALRSGDLLPVVRRDIRRQHVAPARRPQARVRGKRARPVGRALPDEPGRNVARSAHRTDRAGRERDPLRLRPRSRRRAAQVSDRRPQWAHRVSDRRRPCAPHRAPGRHAYRVGDAPHGERADRALDDLSVWRRDELRPDGDALAPCLDVGNAKHDRQRLGGKLLSPGHADLRFGRRHRDHDPSDRGHRGWGRREGDAQEGPGHLPSRQGPVPSARAARGTLRERRRVDQARRYLRRSRLRGHPLGLRALRLAPAADPAVRAVGLGVRGRRLPAAHGQRARADGLSDRRRAGRDAARLRSRDPRRRTDDAVRWGNGAVHARDRRRVRRPYAGRGAPDLRRRIHVEQR